jgi:uncharacterized protein (TIGR04255 family)
VPRRRSRGEGEVTVHYRADHPDFADPPVIETVLGVEFAALDRWSIPHFGLYWQGIRHEYPKTQIQPPLAPEDSRSKDDKFLQVAMIEMIAQPPIRCWYINEPGTRLLQIQKDRFIHNWRKEGSREEYPRYETIRPIFEREWRRFCDFLLQEDIDIPKPARCEVTYVNHLIRGREWQNFKDLPRVFPAWTWLDGEELLASPDLVAFNTRYPFPEKKGHLSVHLVPATRQMDNKDILQLTLTARGRPATPDVSDVMSWFDYGREKVVQAFCDLTSPQMHSLWGKRE